MFEIEAKSRTDPDFNKEGEMPEPQRFHNVVAGRKPAASSGQWFASTNPLTGKNRVEVPHCCPDTAGAAAYASASRSTKHMTLKLGGKSPHVVCADAKLDDTMNGTICGLFAASGQTCIAGSWLAMQRPVCSHRRRSAGLSRSRSATGR